MWDFIHFVGYTQTSHPMSHQATQWWWVFEWKINLVGLLSRICAHVFCVQDRTLGCKFLHFAKEVFRFSVSKHWKLFMSTRLYCCALYYVMLYPLYYWCYKPGLMTNWSKQLNKRNLCAGDVPLNRPELSFTSPPEVQCTILSECSR